MLSQKQYQEKLNNVQLCVDCFLRNDISSIQEVADKTKIPRSSVQRYLNDFKFIKEIYKTEFDTILKLIEEKLVNSKINGTITGGKNSTKFNEPIKDEEGHFVGSKKRI